MLKHTVAMFTIALTGVLMLNASLSAQPGPDALKKLEADLEKLRGQVKETEAKLAKAKEVVQRKGGFEGKKGGFGPKGFEGKKGGFGKGFEGKKGGFGPKGFEKKKDEPKTEGRKSPPPAGGAKLDPATIKEKYEYYKKLYDELPKRAPKGEGFKGKGPFGKDFKGKGPARGPEANSTEARIDRLTRELEDLRRSLKKR